MDAIDKWYDDENNYSLDESKNLQEVVVTRIIRDLVKNEEDKKMADFIMRYLYCNSLGGEPSQLSAKWLEQDYIFNGDEHVFPGGFSQIIKVLAKDIKINLN